MISIYALHDRFIVQSPDYQQQHLKIYRQSPQVETVDGPLDPHLVINASSHHSYGIVGVIQLLAGRYLLHISDAEIVSTLMGYAVYKVLSVGIIPFSTRSIQDDLPDEVCRAEESLYLEMIRSVLISTGFHFSYLYDLTNSAQRISGNSLARSGGRSFPDLISSADHRFFWNRHLLLGLGSVVLSPWAVVLVSGYFCCRNLVVNNVEFQYALYSRRSCLNAGKRFTRRGVDRNGNPTNFAEQEQIVCCKPVNNNDGIINVSSFVQTRGSIPLLWTQEACMKWAPPVHISLNSESKLLLEKHLSDHARIYGRTVLLSLINQCGKEAALSSALSSHVPPYCPGSDDRYSLVSFDFHRRCKNMKYENIQFLLDEVNDHLKAQSFFSGSIDRDGIWTVHQNQSGCFRSNCMDCLDRTNVVQSAIAKSVLASQLQRCNIIKDGAVEDFPALYSAFREIWADNADAMSVLYSGTNALKTDYTRTGTRSIIGACNDGKNSVIRYYLNNFRDGYAQDALDLFLGNYKVMPVRKVAELPYASCVNEGGLSSLFNYVISKSFFIFISTLLLTSSAPTGVQPSISNVVAFSMLIGPVISLAMAQRDGLRFVDKPKLLPFNSSKSDDVQKSMPSNPSLLKSE